MIKSIKFLKFIKSIESVKLIGLIGLAKSNQVNKNLLCEHRFRHSVAYVLRDWRQNYLFFLVVYWEKKKPVLTFYKDALISLSKVTKND